MVDLRNMTRSVIVRSACEGLAAGAARREQAFALGRWREWRDHIRRCVVQEMGDMPFAENGGPLNVRLVSHHHLTYCDLENLLFESFPGWQVNASLFLPRKEHYPPPWPAVIIPVGHSAKTRANYQLPAQYFAACGYAAILFDPPGMAGEKGGRNDHFVDGVRCYLTGASSNRYFVLDALRCIDYLQTRSDIDRCNGFAMTGVSGGGTTTLYAHLLDDRITVIGPVCCAVPSIQHPVLDGYAPCTETLAFNHFGNGIDDIDLLASALPRPVLFMYGEKDEVFKKAYSVDIAAAAGSCYDRAGFHDRFAAFADTCGHAYSGAMAEQFVYWMDRWLKPDRVRGKEPSFSRIELLADSLLSCYPDQETTIFSLNRQLALDLHRRRATVDLREMMRETMGPTKSAQLPRVRAGEPFRIWAHELQELILQTEQGIELPATLLCPLAHNGRIAGLLFFDDRGRWTELHQEKILAQAVGFLDGKTADLAVLTVDLRGWGDTQSAQLPYEMASWGHSSRWISYVSAANGDPITAMRIRDGLSALAFLRTIQGIDPERIIVAGHGMGGVVAQHVAAYDGSVIGLCSIAGLAAFECLAVSEQVLWSHEDFLPNVLKYYDLPELLTAWKNPVLLVNPLDARKRHLNESARRQIFAPALAANPRMQIVETEQPAEAVKTWIEKLLQ
ncbi:alpha/beta fold hydrolase [bacterium]|nr:alpha/beta fold hydrolase [bacterium]